MSIKYPTKQEKSPINLLEFDLAYVATFKGNYGTRYLNSIKFPR